jgi:Ca2+-transporting ATPase
MGEGERNVLERPPRNPKEPILGRPQWIAIVFPSFGLTAGTFGALALARLGLELDSRSTVTVTFLTLGFRISESWWAQHTKRRRLADLHRRSDL